MIQAIVAEKLLTLLIFATLADPGRALAARQPDGQLEAAHAECAWLTASQGGRYGTTDCHSPSTPR